ncbi:MAG: TonB family protein [Opitutaceae bacterium]|jgi:protein TonB
MKLDLIFGVLFALLVHGAFLFSGYFFNSPVAAKPVAQPAPTVELMALPPVEPEPPDMVENTGDTAPDLADLAPPSLADTPSASIDSAFVQQIQPPPPPGMTRPTGAITIPVGRPSAGPGAGGLGNIFDLASLDQRPVVRYQSPPNYPIEMRRAGIAGEAVVMFIVDAQGNVRDAQAVRSSRSEFEEDAVKAVLKWKFRPGKKAGVAVNTRMQVPIGFSLSAE